jgi:uncharacterized protein YjiK
VRATQRRPGRQAERPVPTARQFASSIACGVFLAVALLCAAATGAAQQAATGALARFDLRAGTALTHELPAALNEVSGLATTADGRLFAHGDERAVVYQLEPRSGRVVKHFLLGRNGVRGDFEGIAIAGERFFLVDSQGVLYEFREGNYGEVVAYRRTPTGVGDRCEVEGLAHDARTNALLLACKTVRSAASRGHIVVLAYSLARQRLEPTPRLRLPLAALRDFGLQPSFHPSSIEVHPSGSLLLVAARDEAILEVTREGRIVVARRLDRRRHPQPEGLALLRDGSLVIADEAQSGRRASLSVYPPSAAARTALYRSQPGRP